MSSKNHIHKYKLINIGSKDKPTKVYGCALPGTDCKHYLFPKGKVVGKMSICWKCDAEFMITADISRKSRVYPTCPRCRGKVVLTKKTESKLDKVMENILGKFL